MIRKQASIVSIREREQWLQQLVSAGALACECHIMFPSSVCTLHSPPLSTPHQLYDWIQVNRHSVLDLLREQDPDNKGTLPTDTFTATLQSIAEPSNLAFRASIE